MVLVHALAINDRWSISPDAGLYLALGRSLAEGRGMEFNGAPFWNVPPLLPLAIAGCRLLAGDHYWLINAVLSGCAVAAVALVGLSVRRRSRPDLAPPVVLVAGLSAYLFIAATRIQTDVLFTCLVAAGIYCFVRASDSSPAWAWPGVVALLAATGTRLPGLLFLAGAGAGLLLPPGQPGRRWRLLAAAGTIVAGSILFWLWSSYIRTLSSTGAGDYLSAMEERLATAFLDRRHLASLLEGLGNLPESFLAALTGQRLTAWVAIWPMLAALTGLVILARRGEWIVVLAVAFYVGFLVFLGGPAVARRYLMPAMPYLAYAMLVAVEALVAWLYRRRPDAAGKAQRVAVIVTAVVCLAISLPKVARHIWWMHAEPFYEVYEHGQWQGYPEACRYLREHGRPNRDVVLGPQPSVVHYLSGLHVATGMLTQEYGAWDPTAVPPEEFARAAAAGPYRFALIPTVPDEWHAPAAAALQATGVFESPQVFGKLAVYTRRTKDGGPP